MFRFISIWQRKQRFRKDEQKTLSLFHKYKAEMDSLPPYVPNHKKLLIIRLDDIGDYLLFRNTLPAYRQSPRWHGYEITLLGNIVWKELFDTWDRSSVDKTIWLSKKEYSGNENYRRGIWTILREQGFEAVICPSATRPILLDDVCRLATGAGDTFGFANITPHRQWKQVSDALYAKLYQPAAITHEFFLNQQFANWCCDTNLSLARPFIEKTKTSNNNYLVCFIGASTRSKRWPQKKWIAFINLAVRDGLKHIKVVGVGQHKEEAIRIANDTGVQSVTGTTLPEAAALIANAAAIITNDTMAAHLGASFQVPLVIISTGSNFLRFTEYCEANIENVRTLYPSLVEKRKERQGHKALHNHIAATSDIATVRAETVYAELKQLLQAGKTTKPESHD